MKNKNVLRNILFIVVICSFSIMALGATVGNEENRIEYERQVKILNDDLEKLTCDEFEGRLAGTKGNEKAVEFLVDRFKGIGLKYFNGESYLLPYKQEVYYPHNSNHLMKVIFKNGEEKTYKYGKDYLDYIKTDDLNIRCKLVYGEELKNIDTRNMRGDIGVVIDRERMGKNIFYSNTKAIIKRTDEFVGVPFIARNDRGDIQIKKEVYDEIVKGEAQELVLQNDYETEIKEVNNVIGKIQGENNDSKKAYVISAHLDHVGKDGELIFPGAVDNASGTIAVMNIAEQIVSKKFNNDIYIAAFNGEEYGLYGSRAFADYLKGKYEELIVINLDCVGKINGGKLGIHGEVDKNDSLKESVAEVLHKYKIDTFNDSIPNSDHSSFCYDEMYSVSLIQEKLFNEGEAIHTRNDKVALVDCKYIKNLCDAVVKYLQTENI